MAFLSLFDERERPKGSRDPLGFEMVWTFWGRKVVGNLTTITSSVNNFAVALLGFYWANEIAANVPKAERTQKTLQTFLRYEQLAGYLRYIAEAKDDDGAILGITRIKERIEPLKAGEKSPKSFRLGHEKKYQILSNQVGYGLWGFYSTALQSAEGVDTAEGLIKGSDRTPTAKGAAIAQDIEKHLGDDVESIKALFLSDKTLDYNALCKVADGYANAISSKDIKKSLVNTLMKGFGVAEGEINIQADLWEVTQDLYKQKVEIDSPKALSSHVQANAGCTEPLKNILDSIENVELFLHTCNIIFEYCQTQTGESVSSIATRLKSHFTDVSYLQNSLPLGNYRNREKLEEIRQLICKESWADVVIKIVALNHAVMDSRGGGSWLDIENGILEVKVRGDRAKLIPLEKIQNTWRYNYFLASFKTIADTQFNAVVG